MKPIAKKIFTLFGKFYEPGDEIDIKSKIIINRLNERGFIEPMTPKQIQEFEDSEIQKKEEE